MKLEGYEVIVSKRYPLNLELRYEGEKLGYWQTVPAVLNAIVRHNQYHGIGSNQATFSSLLEKSETLCNRLESAIDREFLTGLDTFMSSYRKLYNLCTDFYVKDVSVKGFMEELRPLLGISLEEAESLHGKRRTRAK